MSGNWRVGVRGPQTIGHRSFFTRCRRCGERIVLIEHENESIAPALEPPTTKSRRFVRHECPAAGFKTIHYRVPVDHPDCQLHAIRPDSTGGFSARCTLTGRIVPESLLDADCRHVLHLVQHGFKPGRGFTSHDAQSLVHDPVIIEGFAEGSTIAQIRRGKVEIPHAPGIYVVLNDRTTRHPRFRAFSPAGHFKGRNPTVSLDRLRSEWVPNTRILYIGKSQSLRERIDLMLRFGKGEPVGKWGGRFIWQLQNAESLLVAWKAMDGDPGVEEKRLLRLFVDQHGRLPFANLRLG